MKSWAVRDIEWPSRAHFSSSGIPGPVHPGTEARMFYHSLGAKSRKPAENNWRACSVLKTANM